MASTMASLPIEETCIMCQRRGLKSCGSCKAAKYCSKECQILDFQQHKLVCKQVDSTRPDEFHRRGLFFPGKDEKPQLVIRVKTARVASGDHDEEFEAAPFGVETQDKAFSIRSNIQARCLTRTLIPGGHEEVAYHISRDSAHLPPNRVAQKFTRAGVGGSWLRGPILVLRHFGGYTQKRYQDIEMRDVRYAADFFSFFDRDQDLQHHKYLAAVVFDKTSAEGTSGYHARAIDGNDELWGRQGSAISNLIGIPILIGRLQGDTNPQILSYNHVERLAVDLNATKVGSRMAYHEEGQGPAGEVFKGRYGFGSPAVWYNPSGPRCAVRADGVPLLREHLEALVEYAKQKVDPLIAEGIADLPIPSEVACRTRILESINKVNFLSFFDEYKIQKGGNWSVVPSPWETTGQVSRINAFMLPAIFDEQARTAPPGEALTIQRNRATRQMLREKTQGSECPPAMQAQFESSVTIHYD